MSIITRGFFGRKREEPPRQLPPGQYLERGFPVLSAGPTPNVDIKTWDFTVEFKGETIGRWNWDEFMNLPQTDLHTDIHCVTKWSKLDTDWRGVTIDDFLADAGIDEPPSDYVMAWCDGGYTTNLPTEDIVGGKAMLAHTFDNEPLEPAHGGPVRLFVPAPLPVEVRQMGPRHQLPRQRLPWFLGSIRLSHVRRPLARATIPLRLSEPLRQVSRKCKME